MILGRIERTSKIDEILIHLVERNEAMFRTIQIDDQEDAR